MPTLHWIGKDKVVKHHHEVPFKTLRREYVHAAPEGTPANSTGNRIIHGDNLEALKALLPEFEGRVKCIYIDPPYNTGNEGWVYNDNVNDPRIQKWLHQVVGKEGEDLSRHDKWLCMMYPRLKLLHRLLALNGSIWISIDDIEVANLRLVLDEIFGAGNFVGNVIWEKADSPRNSARQFSTDHDHILVYSKNPEWTPFKLPRTEESDSIYQNPDDDERGPWIPGDPFANKPYSKGLYTITGPSGKQFSPPPGRFWRISEEKLLELDSDGRIWWGPTGDARPSIKRYLNEVSDLVPRTLWKKESVGSNRTSKNEMRAIFPETSSFDTPKPCSVIERILLTASDKNSIVIDSFAGSGTTAHAVLKLNAQDGGNRRFILTEMMDYAETITAERVRRVMNGYGRNQPHPPPNLPLEGGGTMSHALEGGGTEIHTLEDGGTESPSLFESEGVKNLPPLQGEGRGGDGVKKGSFIPGLGGSFEYCTIGEALFDEDGNLNDAVPVEEIRRYVAYTEGVEYGLSEMSPYYIGQANHAAYLFHYEPDRATALDYEFLNSLQFTGGARPATLVVYADNCLLSQDQLRKHCIIFKKIPRDITRF
ncbi:MAG TPA: site-specific DNA-methyltransferase [Desulfuromonadales bacterium]|nr:site-specific DNA-methyltransferase [Desulfuromonadales bacterium]